ncbi:MAG: hypothetical protein RLZ10_942 [Bacteroidota bacterium]|jgi:hypothetical protein
MINDFMTKIFGQNWRTTFWGIFSAIASFIATYPDLLSPLPDYWEHLVKQIIAFSIAGGFVKWGLSGRDHKVSEDKAKELEQKIEDIQHKYEKF